MLLERFIEHLTYEQRSSPHTVLAYQRDLEQLAVFLKEKKGKADPELADERVVRAWMMSLMEGGASPRTVNRKLSSVRTFFRFARRSGHAAADPTALLEPPKTPKRLPEFIEERGMQLLFTGDEAALSYKGLTDRTVLELLYGTGMRLAELLGLKPDDVDLTARTLRVLGKRNKERIIPMSDRLTTALRSYLEARRSIRTDEALDVPLLLDGSGKPLARRTVQRTVERYLSRVTTQRKRSPHVLRHTFATHLLNNGADLNAVKELLGHASLGATQVYTHNTVEKLRTAHRKAHPRGGE
ncbi:MAG: tyrosine-type recombinase/integrase [Flavobacteriales bacterium]